MPWITDEWKGCYPSNWKGMVVEGAMTHPAKFSSKLIRRIYEHMRAEGWVKVGDRVIDPFGGVALGSLDAMRLGLEWFGVELELKFVDLGQHNISNWEAKYHTMPKWGKAVLCQGDSRKLIQVLKGNSSAAATRSSPPYAESEVTAGNVGGKMMDKWGDGKRLKVEDGIAYGNSDGQLGAMKGDNFEASVGSPPYAMTDLHYKKNGIKENGKDKHERPYMQGQGQDNYGATEGQLGEMRGDNFEASISSPPFADSLDRGVVDAEARRPAARLAGISNAEHISPIDMEKLGQRDQGDYGDTPGQLGAMPVGDFDASISSPPFIDQSADGGWQMLDKYAKEGKLTVKQAKGDPNKSYPSWAEGRDTSYGKSEGQLSNMPAGDFNAAAMRSSPPFGEAQTGAGIAKKGYQKDGKGEPDLVGERSYMPDNQGQQDGNLANMSTDNFSAAISSPPFRHSEGGTGAQGGTIDPALMKRHAAGNSAAEGYGESAGQLANMGEGTESFEAAMKSPPYEGDVVKARSSHLEVERTSRKGMDRTPGMTGDVLAQEQYGTSEGQLGNDSGDDFWAAARKIVEQVYLALAPGGHAVWVVKKYVKNKELVPFDDQWRQLCEAVGFITLHEHRALLVHAKSYKLEGGEHIHESKSFFRRVIEKKGSPRVDFEVVWCMEKPMVLPMPAHYVGDNGH